MSNIIQSYIDKKKEESPYITLVDGESIKIKKLKDIRSIVKAGFGGEEKEFIRLVCEVDTSFGPKDKHFDNATQRFAQEMQDKGVTVGSSFTITRTGSQTKTRYHISEVSGVASAPAAPSA